MSRINASYRSELFLFLFLSIIAGNFTIAGAPATAPAAAAGPESITLRFQWFHQFQFAGYYAAVKKGFYREVGLDVKLEQRKPGDEVIAFVTGAEGRYGVSNSEIMLRRLHGQPLVALAVIFQHSPVILLTRDGSGITTPQDLIGKKVMMKSKYKNAELWATLNNEGISPQKVHMVEGAYAIDKLQDGSIDAASGYITDQPWLLRQKGILFHYIKPSMYGIDFYGDCLFTSEQEVKKHPERVKAFREASLKGWEYAMAYPEEIIDIIVTQYGTPLSRGHLQYEAEEMRKLIIPDLVEIGHMNPGRWKHIADTFVRLRMADPSYSLQGFLYEPNPVVDYSWVKWGIAITLFIALLGSLGIIVLLSFNKRLHKEVEFRKQTEEKLRAANEEAVAATHAKSEFLAKMSHEIRTPMNGVIGMANLLTHTPLNAEQKEYIDAIHVSGNNLLRIINNILDFTKIEAGKMEIQEEIFNVTSCVEEIFTIFKQKAAEKDIRLHYCIAPGVPLFLKSDVTLLKQVLINLVNNAMKFMEDGEIFLSITTILVKNNRVTIKCSVKDEGIGISPDKIDMLFDAFSQVDSTNARRYEGTGLGLAISKQLVELLGGDIWAKSKPGVGSTFFFTIDVAISNEEAYNEQIAQKNISAPGTPAKETGSKPGLFSTEAETNRNTFQVLVAEDNKINQKLVFKLLTKMGYRVAVADNGFEALKALEQQFYPLILMDIQMPKMDGVEATRIILSRYPPGKRPKIIALTANALQGDREKYLDMGMADYISKPINVPVLKEKMAKWSRLLTDN